MVKVALNTLFYILLGLIAFGFLFLIGGICFGAYLMVQENAYNIVYILISGLVVMFSYFFGRHIWMNVLGNTNGFAR